jgi:uncharacterized membrane protein YtjA (UPF0391 family)
MGIGDPLDNWVGAGIAKIDNLFGFFLIVFIAELVLSLA